MEDTRGAEEEEEVRLTEQYVIVLYKNEDSEDHQYEQLTIDDKQPESNATSMYIAAITASLLLFSCSSCLGWINPAISSLENPDRQVNPLGRSATPLEISWIDSLFLIGATFDLFLPTKLADTVGRKGALMYISIIHVVSLVLQAYATDIKLYYVTRFVSGYVLASVLGLVPVYLVEIAETRHRSTVAAIMTVFLSSGIMFSLVIGPLVSVRLLTLGCAMPATLFLLLSRFFMPESPMFLAIKGDTRGLSRVLMKLRRQTANQIQQEMRVFMKDMEEETKETGGVLKKLFTDTGLRKSLIVCLGLFVFQQFSGVTALTVLLEHVFTTSGTSLSNHASISLVMLVQFLVSIMAIVIVGKFSRRSLLIFSSTGTSVASSALAICLHIGTNTTHDIDSFFWPPIALYFIMSGLGLAVLPWILAAEIFPTRYRATASLMGSFCCFLSLYLVNLWFSLVMDTLGIAYCFWVSSTFSLMTCLFVYYLVP